MDEICYSLQRNIAGLKYSACQDAQINGILNIKTSTRRVIL